MSTLSDIRWLKFKNNGSQEVPAFGAIEIIESTNPRAGQVVLSGQRPSSNNLPLVAFNGPSKVAAGKHGSCTFDTPMFALYDTADTPVNNDEWGAQPDLFTLKKGNTGFVVLGGILSSPDRCRFQKAGAVGGGYLAKGAITAASGTTPGSGTATLYERDKTTGLITVLQDAASVDRTETVYSAASTPISATVYYWVSQHMNGDWWATGVYC